MATYFEKARELGELLLASEESLRLADARANYKENGALSAELLSAEKDLNMLVSQVLSVITSTVTGELVEEYAAGCGKSCGGCGNHNKHE
ncbi:MAG: hypothetical protein LBU77_02215 [Clostridiales bacterium]|jgi:hypothetical protein|nr:hypothetical protein [Clostridiales bacterium]